MSRQLEEELVRHRQSTLLAGRALLFLPHSKAAKAADGDHDDHDEIFNGGVLPKAYQCKGFMMMVMI